MSQSTSTDVTEFIDELNAGVFKEKLAAVLSNASLGVCIHGGAQCQKAKVTVEFSITQVGENPQVIVAHTLSSIIPTKRGKKMEVDTTSSPFFVGKGGAMTALPPKEEDSGQTPFQLNTEHDGKITPLSLTK